MAAHVGLLNRSKGEKWKALNEILGLEGVNALRLNLQTPANQLAELPKPRLKSRYRPGDALEVHNVEGRANQIVAAVRDLCKLAAIEPPNDLAGRLRPKESLMANIELIDLTKHYRQGTGVIRALDGVSLQIESGGSVSFVGRSGIGKTTLLDIDHSRAFAWHGMCARRHLSIHASGRGPIYDPWFHLAGALGFIRVQPEGATGLSWVLYLLYGAVAAVVVQRLTGVWITRRMAPSSTSEKASVSRLTRGSDALGSQNAGGDGCRGS